MNRLVHTCVLGAFTTLSHPLWAADDAIELGTIEVKASSIADAYPYSASTATKTDTPLIETPLSIQVVPEEVLGTQNAQKIADVIRNVSGVQTQHSYGGVMEQYSIRGFLQTASGYRNGIRIPLLRFDLANVERVEVLKGPASMLYGPTDPSGLINIVTKKPQKETAYSFQQSIGSFDFFRTQASATGAIDDAGILSYRIDAGWSQTDSYRDVTNSDRYVIPMALAFRPNDKLEINLSVEPQRDRMVYDRGVPVVNGKIADVPRSRSFNQNDHDDYKSMSTDLNGSYRFDNGWKLAAGVFNNVQDRDLNIIYFGNADASGNINRNTYIGEEHFKTRTSWANVTGDLETGPIKHKLLFGTEYINSRLSFGVFDRSVDSVNVFTYKNNYIDLDPLLTGSYDGFGTYKVTSLGFYAQDQIKLNDQWQLHAGLRHDNVKQDLSFAYYSPTDIYHRNDSKTTPRIGLLYQPVQWLSLYGNCAESFGMSFNYEADTLYKPEEARQCEVGMKAEVLDGRFSVNVAAFDLTKTNIPTPNPVNANRTEAIGEAQSKGLEVDVQGKITDNLRAIGSLALTDTEITKDGRGNQGNRLPYAPKYQYSLWLDYNVFGTQPLGLSVGGGLFGSGQRYGDAANTYSDGKYTTVDLYTAYKFMLNKTKVTTQINVNNVFNEKFYYLRSTSSNLPNAPTNAIATVRFDF
ncbi:TonB-dependent siderophore receptor [Methylotenera sp. 1P/1]|uniref:TonB-dependent siderophore receptor n=1 Tax=Methylotenera sp. 1P/1 TaxID=1131551 RepID=UPI000380EB32|nr:TonB-dependent siderophore receptor [Methylotenera sp. 1P/1]